MVRSKFRGVRPRVRGCLIVGLVTCPLGDRKPRKQIRKTVSVKPGSPGSIVVGLNTTSSAPSANPGSSVTQVTTVVQ
jgi:hypothetical protein